MTQRRDGQLQMTFGGLAVLLTLVASTRDWVQGDAFDGGGPHAIVAIVGAAAALNGYRRWKTPEALS